MRRVASQTRLRVPSSTSIPFLLPLQEKALAHVPVSVIVSWSGGVATDHSQSLGTPGSQDLVLQLVSRLHWDLRPPRSAMLITSTQGSVSRSCWVVFFLTQSA